MIGILISTKKNPASSGPPVNNDGIIWISASLCRLARDNGRLPAGAPGGRLARPGPGEVSRRTSPCYPTEGRPYCFISIISR